MPEIGQSLSHYSLVEKIGKGGMGEVYRAKDQRLGRDVAIKVLPEEFALDTDRVARFQREAKLLASLTKAAKTWGPSWGVDNMIVYAQLGEGVFRVSANGGTPEMLIGLANEFFALPQILPDGKSIWILDLARETTTRLTFDGAFDMYSLWTPDGQRIVFASDREEGGIYLKAADGTGEVECLVSVPDRRWLLPLSWSSDGKTLVLFELGGAAGTGYDIGALSMEGDRTRKPLLQEKHNEMQPKISPDGRWIAYTSDESGYLDIYVRPFPDLNKGRWQVSTDGGHSPLWSPDSRELFYLNSDAEGIAAMAVSVATEPTFKPGKPELLFRGMYVGLTVNDAHTWHISPDGKRFLMMKQPSFISESYEEGGPRKITVVLNWFEELRQRVPVD